MSPAISILGERVWELPPLILHPFNERVAPSTLLESSKAALMLTGLIPDEGIDREGLRRRLLSGRYAEMRMLFYLGKDVFRWLDQCVEWAQRMPEFASMEIRRPSFAELLTRNPPGPVKEKLTRWGVADYTSIFSRAIGMNAVFVQPPALESLNEDFLSHYHKYPDYLYRCYMEMESYQSLPASNFRFALYASGEYSRMLESEWGDGMTDCGFPAD
jgi:hypothetical protein